MRTGPVNIKKIPSQIKILNPNKDVKRFVFKTNNNGTDSVVINNSRKKRKCLEFGRMFDELFGYTPRY